MIHRPTETQIRSAFVRDEYYRPKTRPQRSKPVRSPWWALLLVVFGGALLAALIVLAP